LPLGLMAPLTVVREELLRLTPWLVAVAANANHGDVAAGGGDGRVFQRMTPV